MFITLFSMLCRSIMLHVLVVIIVLEATQYRDWIDAVEAELVERQQKTESAWRDIRSRRNVYLCKRQAKVESYGRSTPISYTSFDPPPQPGTEVMKASGVKEQLAQLKKSDAV